MEDELTVTSACSEELLTQKKFIKTINDLGVTLDVKGNRVIISSENALSVLCVKNSILAFNRGFDPKTALLLLDDSYDLAVINIKDYANSEKRQIELKGRVIGSRGIIKQRLSAATSCYIKVFGKTISIIGGSENLQIAIDAIEMLLNGANHDRVFSMIEKKRLEAYENGSS